MYSGEDAGREKIAVVYIQVVRGEGERGGDERRGKVMLRLLHSSFKQQQVSYSFKLLPANFKQAVTASLSGTTHEII